MIQNNQLEPSELKSEITLLDAIHFIQESWKKLALASMLGALLGLVGWGLLGKYQAEYILVNSNNSYALDLVSWKTIQKSLPNLAAQITDEGKAPEEQAKLYGKLSDEEWWQKNVVSSYVISKADTKDLASISKDLDLASTTILNLTIKADGASKMEAIKNVKGAANFLRTGSAYLQLRNLLNNYETDTISTVAEVKKKITATETEMSYQLQRAKSLEELHKRFPGGNSASNQVVDPKDSGAKYLPLATQIIAVNNDINQSKESLERLRDRITQIALIKIFLDEAIPLSEKTFDGILLADNLLATEAKLRSNFPKVESKQQEVFDQLRSQILFVKSRFTKGLDSNTAPTAVKKGMLKGTAGGLIGAFFLMLSVLLAKRVLQSVKSGGACNF